MTQNNISPPPAYDLGDLGVFLSRTAQSFPSGRHVVKQVFYLLNMEGERQLRTTLNESLYIVMK